MRASKGLVDCREQDQFITHQYLLKTFTKTFSKLSRTLVFYLLLPVPSLSNFVQH